MLLNWDEVMINRKKNENEEDHKQLGKHIKRM